MEPSPCSELKRAADEMNVEGTEERYPMEPNPTNELVSCGVEMILDRVSDDR